tara:strand:+ start:330 stop:761 length:432 start_codon:yes stop_codon:yes gene_type:complete
MGDGAKANYTGKSFEKEVQKLLIERGYNPQKPPRYEAVWGTGRQRNQADKWLEGDDTQIELKYQSVPGTCDQKPFAELWNASRKISCQQYVLVLGGPHWETTRGNNIYEESKQMAEWLNAIPNKTGAKKLSVMKYSEFKEWKK